MDDAGLEEFEYANGYLKALMIWSLNAWLLIGVLVFGHVCLAANKEEGVGKALIERANQVSDIRADGAPSFRLKVGFKTYKNGSATQEGTYTEIWASKGQWRRETVLGDYDQTIVVNGKKRWTLPKGSIAPLDLGEVGFQMGLMRFSFFSIPDRIIDSVAVRCIQKKSGLSIRTALLCFDKSTGTIVTKTVLHQLEGLSVDNECTYGDYQKFGEKMIPGTIRCRENAVLVFEEAVVDLVMEPSPDAALFEALTEGKESVNCQGDPTPPKAVYTPEPAPPRHENLKNPVVVLWLIVGKDGVTRDIGVVRSVDKAFDAAALEAVRRWRFKPATCDGEPIETSINVEINFPSFR